MIKRRVERKQATKFVGDVCDFLGDVHEVFSDTFDGLQFDLKCGTNGYTLLISDCTGRQQFTMMATTLNELRRRFVRHVKFMKIAAGV